jgi:transcriptional regulator with XRE-family HTH domain
MVGRVLRQLRLEAGMRQDDVATRLARPQSYVSKYEAGERSLDLIEAIEVARALGVPTYDLVDRLEGLLPES